MEQDNNKKNDRGFLSQIPDWEEGYKETDKTVIDFKKEDWKKADADFTEHDLKIFGHAVMEDWETPYMKELAVIAGSRGGDVLELGYGMGISANFIQQQHIAKHIVIEANHEVANKAREFAKKAPHPVEVLEGFWEEVIDSVPDNSLGGILFDTYPLTEKELYQNHFEFFPFAYKKLKPGGVFTYYSDEIDHLSDVHMKKLQEAGFSLDKISAHTVKVSPPPDCEYWKAPTILAPVIEK
ncbi:MAG: hypothetical protein AMXMBFR44_1720 [Candidatus Campbellbacteria bacterium]